MVMVSWTQFVNVSAVMFVVVMASRGVYAEDSDSLPLNRVGAHMLQVTGLPQRYAVMDRRELQQYIASDFGMLLKAAMNAPDVVRTRLAVELARLRLLTASFDATHAQLSAAWSCSSCAVAVQIFRDELTVCRTGGFYEEAKKKCRKVQDPAACIRATQYSCEAVARQLHLATNTNAAELGCDALWRLCGRI